MRSLIFELRSAELESDGLVATLRKHLDVVQRVRRTPIELRVEGERRLSPDVEGELFRIAQEALNNAIKHADAKRIDVELKITPERAALTVRDDGRGFDLQRPGLRSRRLGLTSMRERAESVGGRVRVESKPGEGTAVRVEVPLA